MDKLIKGELVWMKTSRERYDEYEGKKTWSVTVYPDKDSLEIVRELQAIGIKNKLKKDEKGWFVKFSRPFQIEKGGKVVKLLDPPVVTDGSGLVIDGSINNGATGTVRIDFTEGKTPKGKYYTARLEGVTLLDYKVWEPDSAKAAPAIKQENYF